LTPDRDIKLDPINVPLRKEHVESSDGGIAVYFKEAVNYEPKTDHEINGLECVWVELKIKKNKKLCMLLYMALRAVRSRYG
jgi:transposase